MPSPTSAALVLFLGAGALPSPAAGQTADTKEIISAARDTQATFERFRREHLPEPEHFPSGRCDERIGGFCYWYDGDRTPLPPEPEVIAEARRALLDALRDKAALLPDNEWIAGQRVRYLVEEGDTAGAVQVAEACRYTNFWCAALQGFAYHAAGRESAAEQAFSRAYERSTPAGKCIWEDMTPLLDELTAKRYLDVDCHARHNVNRRFLWLADPYIGDGVNDLANELYARKTMARLLENSANPYGMPFSFDQGEMDLRYGWAVRWTRTSDKAGSTQGHEPRPAFAIGPKDWWNESPDRPADPTWDFASRGPRLRYSPPWLLTLAQIPEGQTALFRRGDSTLLAAAFPLPADTTFGPASQALVALSRSAEAPPAVASGTVRAGVGRVLAEAPWYPGLVDVAVRDTAARALARLRRITDPRSAPAKGPALSDVLFLAPDVTPGNLAGAVEQALPSLRIPEGAKIGIFWEMYRFTPGAADLSLLVIRTEEMGSSRLADVREVPKGNTPIRIGWKDEKEQRAAVDPQTLGVDLSRLRRGFYVLVLEARSGPTVSRAVRSFEVIKAAEP